MADAEDLEFKREVAAADPKGKQELAKDICASANHIGSALVIGLTDAKGVPTKVTGIDLADAHLRHVKQGIGSGTAPQVRYETYPSATPTIPAGASSFLRCRAAPTGPTP
ncbi:helix-turn-helix domain-containing protein [Streptomyces sp. ALB3]|uniref:helix-turn-helix domain-containing protein n=1 Tax=Streptomyces sp. ALB3 TaxID=3374278 RepID=UPI003793B236